MINSSLSPNFCCQIQGISRSDRWLVQRRLQELSVNCWCPKDGSLWIEIHHSLQTVLVRSTVYQLMASRQEQIDWLERCWNERKVNSYQ